MFVIASASPGVTLALAFGIGALVTLAASRLKFPAILPLLVVGLFIGAGDYRLNLVDPSSLGDGLRGFVSLAIAMLVFEGSLHLDRKTLRHAPNAVRGLLTIGALVSWVGSALAARLILGWSWEMSVLIGAILIVTGPTVVIPILRRIKLKPALHSSLMAEGILIDPIGVIAAVSTLEIVRSLMQAETLTLVTFLRYFAVPPLAGVVSGVVCGLAGRAAIRRMRSTSHDDVQSLYLVALGLGMLGVGIAEYFAHESGLVAAAIAGMLLANTGVRSIEEVRWFKEQLSVILIGAIFILLAARIQLEQFASIRWEQVVFVLAAMFVVRPLAVLLGTFKTVLSMRERLFVCFLAPRGIVAASLASIIAIEFTALAVEGSLATEARELETAVILLIFASVSVAGLLAGPVARALGVLEGEPNGVLIVGAHRLGRDLALTLMKRGVPVKLVDSNTGNVRLALEAGIDATSGNALDLQWLGDLVSASPMGNAISITDNETVDDSTSRWALDRFGKGRALRWWRGKPTQGAPAAVQWGRPIRHLLFQFDVDLARVADRPASEFKGLPVALIDGAGNPKLLAAETPLEGFDPQSTVIGVEIGPPPRAATPHS